ncbi:MAG: formimidoylglutamase [Gemmataceae bacterium]|nr:formimidoylglutamase [Gemmataceae bacterium]
MTPDMCVWTGRVDAADGPLALRWHPMVKPLAPDGPPGVVLIGFACDEGVRRNGGRIGAKDGPRAIRAALANLAWHQDGPVYDAGDVACDDGDLEAAQTRLANVVATAIRSGHRPLVLGGGHETAWGTFQGITAVRPEATVGVINIDAHLDLRGDETPNSGTPFRQIADRCRERGRPFRYLCLGVAEPANTRALFSRAADLGADWARDADILPWRLDVVLDMVTAFAASVDLLHLSLDLDVLPAAVMPAVSAPAARGVPFEAVEALVAHAIQTRNVAACDVVEFNPSLDFGGTSARAAARLAWTVAAEWSAFR